VIAMARSKRGILLLSPYFSLLQDTVKTICQERLNRLAPRKTIKLNSRLGQAQLAPLPRTSR